MRNLYCEVSSIENFKWKDLYSNIFVYKNAQKVFKKIK